MSSSQTELSIFDEKADQVRLKEITVYNWGSFNGLHTLHIDSEGTLITGDNGSGKSTIIDGLMTLIRPAGKVSYNIAAAQEQKKDRTLVSYMRGSYGTTVTDEGQISRNLRSNSVVTVLKSLYEFDISHQKVVLLGVFYINGDSNALSDVKRIYAVANSDIDVARMLKAFGNLDTRNLKNYLNSIEGCTVCDDSFSAYETHFRRRLRMDNKNATALLSRALGLKRIDDLTGLIRSLVLEPGEVKEDAINTIAQFEDLKEIHNRLEDARTQSNTLKDLPKDNNRYEHSLNLVTRYEKAIADAETYIAKCALEAYSSEVSDNEKSLSLLNLHLQDIEDQIRKARIILDNCNTSLKEGGGGRTIKIREEIDTEKLHLRDARKEQTAYNTLALALGLKAASDESIFLANLKVLEELKPDLVKKNETCIEEQVSLATRKRALETAKKDQENILYELKKRPGSNVSFRYQNFRNGISSDLNIPTEKLVFAAELIDVPEEQRDWQGAIERALGGIRETLLVSRDDYQLITRYVNGRFNEGLHVRIQIAETNFNENTEFGSEGYLSKLVFKKHPYTLWLKKHLEKFDLICANNIDELNRTEYSLTKEGLIHRKGGFFEKKDLSKVDDRREWFLGFSNADKIKLLEGDLRVLNEELSSVAYKITELKKNAVSISNSLLSIERLHDFDSFLRLDVNGIEERILKLEKQLDELEKDPTIARLTAQRNEAASALNSLDSSKTGVVGQIAVVKKTIEDLKLKIASFELKASATVDDDSLLLINESLKEEKIQPSNLHINNNSGRLTGNLYKKKEQYSNSANDSKVRIEKCIVSFNSRWPAICSDWGCDIESRIYYLKYFETVENEGLPKLVESFKAKLNSEVTQSVACISQKIEKELSAIKNRIQRINEVLKKAEFYENTYLEIGTKKVEGDIVKEFSKSIRNVMNLISTDDHEQRFKAINKVIETLNLALTSNAFDYKSILDTRLRMQFVANVIDKRTMAVKDTLNSSSGKSGGEKESFAGSVLAASLAYVLTPEDGEHPVYSTVFLDEAFSNTSENYSERVLKIFKELKLHINLITPFKNIELARNFAKSLVIMKRDGERHSSSMCELRWEEYDAQLENKIDSEMKALGITSSQEVQ